MNSFVSLAFLKTANHHLFLLPGVLCDPADRGSHGEHLAPHRGPGSPDGM